MSSPAELKGVNVYLRSPVPNDVDARLRLGHDPDIVRMFGGDPNNIPAITFEHAGRWVDQIKAHPHAWVVEHSGELLGLVRLDGLNDTDRRARLAVGFLDPTKLGKGLGKETVNLVLSHAFTELGLHRVDLRVLAFNTRAIRAYLSCGFIEEGREREAAYVAGRWHDDIIMGILSHEFLTP